MIVVYIIYYRLKNIRFYLDFTLEVYICYNKLLFSIYNKENLPFIYIADHIKLRVLRKSMITFVVLIDGKPKVVNFCNIFYAPELKYNLFSVGILEKVNFLILAKKKKMTVCNNKNNIALEATRIKTNYLINISISKKNLAFLSILPLREVELKQYNTDSETSLSSHI